MRTLIAIAGLSIGSVLAAAEDSEPSALVERLKETVGGGVPFYEHHTIAKELQAHGAAAIPHLLPLLHDEHGGVRYVAGVALSDCDGLTDQHLDALVAAQRHDELGSHIPLAIAKVGTPRAVDILMEELLRTRASFSSNVSAAVVRLGDRAVPSLVRIYEGDTRWDAEFERAMFYLLERLKEKAVAAVEPLLKMAGDERAPEAKRLRAIKSVAAIDPPALLQFLGSAGGFPVGTPAIHNDGDAFTTVELMRKIAALRTHAVSAGPFVMKFLHSSDWEVRVAAARTLGRIGYQEAVDELIQVLKRPDDWRLVFGAAESLGLLKSEEAVGALGEVSEAHWYPPVREVALEAITAIHGDASTQEEEAPQDAGRGFFDLDDVGRGIESLSEDEAEKLRLTVVPPQRELRVKIKADNGAVEAEERPGIQVEGGYLVGRDGGEWGGEISFVDPEGNSQILARENTQEIYNIAAGIFAVTGTLHMGFNSGFIYRIRKTANQDWTAEKWRTLPGAPRFSRVLKDGTLFVSCHGGIVLVEPDGEMKWMTLSECLR